MVAGATAEFFVAYSTILNAHSFAFRDMSSVWTDDILFILRTGFELWEVSQLLCCHGVAAVLPHVRLVVVWLLLCVVHVVSMLFVILD